MMEPLSTIAETAKEIETDDDYRSPPLKWIKTMKVRYKFVGKIEPLPFDWEN